MNNRCIQVIAAALLGSVAAWFVVSCNTLPKPPSPLPDPGTLITNIINGVTNIIHIVNPPPAPTNAPPVPVPEPQPAPTNVVVSTLRIGMFQEGNGMPSQEVCNQDVTSPMSLRYIHQKSYENACYTAWFAKLKAVKANTLPFLYDGSQWGNDVLDMYQLDRESPVDRHHVEDGLRQALKAAGITTFINVSKDSPDSKCSLSEATCIQQIKSFTGSGFNHIHMTGFETKRNQTVEQAAQVVQWFKKNDTSHECWVGDQSMDFLLAVVAKCIIKPDRIWLEQPTHPINDPLMVRFMGMFKRVFPIAAHSHVMKQPLTSAQTVVAYKADAARGAVIMGAPSRVVIGEWWAKEKVRRIALTHEFEALGYVVGGGGDWSDR